MQKSNRSVDLLEKIFFLTGLQTTLEKIFFLTGLQTTLEKLIKLSLIKYMINNK
jgi:hypothetical protein